MMAFHIITERPASHVDLRALVCLDHCQDAKHSAVGLRFTHRLADLGLNLDVYPSVRR